MTITTKYDIGDEVWFKIGNHPTEGSISEICIEVNDDKSIYIVLYCRSGLSNKGFEEHDLFKSKEELLKSL